MRAPVRVSVCMRVGVERIPRPGGSVHGVRMRADGPLSRHTGSGGRTQRGSRERFARPACQAQDGNGIRREKGKIVSKYFTRQSNAEVFALGF